MPEATKNGSAEVVEGTCVAIFVPSPCKQRLPTHFKLDHVSHSARVKGKVKYLYVICNRFHVVYEDDAGCDINLKVFEKKYLKKNNQTLY